MKAMILTAFIFVSLEILVVDAVTFRILRVENCTSSNKSIHVEKCDGVENRFSIILDVHRPLNKLNVCEKKNINFRSKLIGNTSRCN